MTPVPIKTISVGLLAVLTIPVLDPPARADHGGFWADQRKSIDDYGFRDFRETCGSNAELVFNKSTFDVKALKQAGTDPATLCAVMLPGRTECSTRPAWKPVFSKITKVTCSMGPKRAMSYSPTTVDLVVSADEQDMANSGQFVTRWVEYNVPSDEPDHKLIGQAEWWHTYEENIEHSMKKLREECGSDPKFEYVKTTMDPMRLHDTMNFGPDGVCEELVQQLIEACISSPAKKAKVAKLKKLTCAMGVPNPNKNASDSNIDPHWFDKKRRMSKTGTTLNYVFDFGSHDDVNFISNWLDAHL